MSPYFLTFLVIIDQILSILPWTLFWDTVVWKLCDPLRSCFCNLLVVPELASVWRSLLSIWGKTFLSVLSSALWITNFSILAVGNSTIPGYVWAGPVVPFNPFGCIFSRLQQFLHTHALICTVLNTWATALQVSLCAALFSPVLSPVDFPHLDLWALCSISSVRGAWRAPLGSSLSSPQPGISLRQKSKLENHRAYLTVSLLSGIIVLHCLLPSVLRTVVLHILSFYCFKQEDKSGRSYSIFGTETCDFYLPWLWEDNISVVLSHQDRGSVLSQPWEMNRELPIYPFIKCESTNQ